MTQVPLTYSPWTGESLPPVSARQHRDHFTYGTWRFNPWTGIRRPQSEIQADPQGLKLTPPTPTCAPRSPLRFSPASGRAFAAQVFTASLYRETHPLSDWFFNPWTGTRRPAAEVEADPLGLKLEPPSHDPGTTSPPTPATTEAGTGTQEPGATDREPASAPPASTSSPTPCAAPSVMNAVLSSLGAAVAEVNALTRTAVELATKCRALQEENDRLRGLFRQIAVNADQSRFGRAVSLLAEEALNPKPGTGPHMRAAAGEGDQTVNQELLSLLQDAVASFAGCVEGGEADPWVKNSRAAIAKATGGVA